MKRLICRVTWSQRGRCWLAKVPWCAPADYATKAEAVREARMAARGLHRDGRLSQLVVHRKDGRIAFEATYGNDPKRRKG